VNTVVGGVPAALGAPAVVVDDAPATVVEVVDAVEAVDADVAEEPPSEHAAIATEEPMSPPPRVSTRRRSSSGRRSWGIRGPGESMPDRLPQATRAVSAVPRFGVDHPGRDLTMRQV